ncbi:M91 family zinc metallopeptidase [Paenibacillus periandrae]|uniref:M91 family zinc metallopeptidase n=1 Tax=Paenibacillus periandrae TaxID=1761741 RepID=UPI001F0986BB|nr:M91 family zinc metallopeptidase [Paenibacillus periandrae]
MERTRNRTEGQVKRNSPVRPTETNREIPATMWSHVLQMQKTVGNRAVGQWLTRSPNPSSTIQMMRDRDTFLTQRTPREGQNELLEQIAEQLEQYRLLSSENDANGQLRLHALKQLDTHIHSWMNTFVERKINEVPNGTLLMSLLRESEDEHRKLVKEIARQEALVPIDTAGLGGEAIETVHTIWREIVAGAGNIKILEKTVGFRDRMLAAIAKLLQGPNGRKLIAELNAAQDSDKKQVILSSNFATELTGTGITDTTSNEAIPRSDLESKDKRYNFKPANDDELVGVDMAAIPGYGGEVGDASALNRFLHENRGQPYFKFNGKVYKTGQSTGSLVRINDEGMKKMVGQGNQEIATPEFVTVGHELGHASRFMKGMVPDSFIGVDQLGVGGKADMKLWHNSEEYLNINSVENEVRDDHGIGKRKYHVGSVDDVNKQVLHERYDLRRTALFNRFEWAARQLFNHKEANKVLRAEFVEPQADFGDPDAIALLMRRLNELEPILAALEPLKGKTPDDLYAKANKAVKSRLNDDEPFQEYKFLFEQAIEKAPLDGLAAELGRLYELAKGRSMSMEFKVASLLEDVDFDFTF